jgi:ribonuclease HI
MLVTMFTDISVSMRHGIGTYAVWAKESGNTLRHVARFKTPVFDSNVAEVLAIVNGLFIVIRQMQPPTDSKIIAQTDSATAISALTPLISHGRYAQALIRRNQILHGRGIEVEYRLVKGHKGHADRRSSVNTWCDRACRDLLRTTIREQE